MGYTVQQIAVALGAEALGATDILITGANEPTLAGAADLALAMSPKYAEGLSRGQARVAMLWPGADWQALGLEAAIIPARPRFAMSGLTAMLDEGQGFEEGIHPTAVIHDSAVIGDGARIGPFCVIAAGARIGEGAVIGPHCSIGRDAVLGQGAYLREGVKIGARVVIGDRFIAQPGAVVGGDGFSFVTPEESAVERVRDTLGDAGLRCRAEDHTWHRIHSLGGVRDRRRCGDRRQFDRGSTGARSGPPSRGRWRARFDNLVPGRPQRGDNGLRLPDLRPRSAVAGSSRSSANNDDPGRQVGRQPTTWKSADRRGGGRRRPSCWANVPKSRGMFVYPAIRPNPAPRTGRNGWSVYRRLVRAR